MAVDLIDPNLPQLLTRAEAADALRVDPKTLDKWIREKRIPAYRIAPGVVRYRKIDVEALFTPIGSAE